MGPKSFRLSEEDHRLVAQANTLLEQLNVGSRIGRVEDLGAAIYVTLFEGLCGEQLTGIVRIPITEEDEIHNTQIVIDTLANDVLHTSLAHISGRQIMEYDRESIAHLLEIYSGLLEYILNKIESDASTDNDDFEEEVHSDDPDAVHSDVIDRILERELGKNRTITPNGTPGRHRTDISSVYWEDSSDVPKKWQGETDALTGLGHESSSGVRDTTESFGRGDTTSELIQDSRTAENLQRLNTFDEEFLRTRPTLRALVSGASQPEPVVQKPAQVVPEPSIKSYTDLYRAKYGIPSTDERLKELDSYNMLNNMVEETAALAREAVDASPSRAKTILQSLDNSYNKNPAHTSKGVSPRLTRSTMASRARSRATSPYRKPKSPHVSPMRGSQDLYSDNELTPDKSKRKVSFLVERSTTSESSPSFVKPSPKKPATKTAWDEKKEFVYQKEALPRASGKVPLTKTSTRHKKDPYGSFLDDVEYYDEKENSSTYDLYLKKQFHEIIDEVLSDDDALPPRHKSRSDQRRVRTEKVPDKSKRIYSVRDTQQQIQKERNFGKKKIDFLQKIYQEDLDELKYEAKHDIGADRKSARDTEKEFREKVLSPKKQVKQKETGAVKKKPLTKATVSSKVKKRSPSRMIPTSKPKLTIKDDDDILPVLLKEFPHLHLSLHTWHELWRKGIQQIEQVSRAHQEVRRKKSRAKTELEDAEKRQAIMVNIMQKELEHQQRLKEVKDRQTQGVAAKNRIHEKRIQSARSRRYYDEYQVRMRSKMLKRRTREETVFRKLFKDGLEIQKDRVKDLRKYAKEQRNSQAKLQRNEVESMENYYRDQFEMLAESVTKERKELMIREKAQQKMMEQMKKELRKKMEKEIKDLQEQLCRDDDDAYFRQLDADRVIHDLQLAKYHVNV